MNKNTIIAVLGIAVVVLLAVVLWPKGPDKEKEYKPEDVGTEFVDENGVTNIVVEVVTVVDGEEKKEIEAAPLVRSVERRPLEPEATKRLHDGPVVITSIFEAMGHAEYAGTETKYLTTRGSYLYTTVVQAKSEIVLKEENETTGNIRVVERRTFTQAKDHLGLSDLDVAIELDTLPVAQVKTFVDGAVNIIGGIATFFAGPAALTYVAGAKAAVAAGFKALNAIDGTSARGMLGLFGVNIPENLEEYVNQRIEQLAGRQLKEVKIALQSIEGKSYVITYTQAANGMPLNVDFTHEDGKPITEAEWEILRSANAFLDSSAVRDTRCKVGDYWTIWAEEIQELFSVTGEGRVDGKVRVTRVDDQPDGSWTLKVEPSEISFRSDKGTAVGKMQVKDGNGLVDAENASVRMLLATAEGDLRSLNKKRHYLLDFIKKFKGDANLRFLLRVDPAE